VPCSSSPMTPKSNTDQVTRKTDEMELSSDDTMKDPSLNASAANGELPLASADFGLQHPVLSAPSSIMRFNRYCGEETAGMAVRGHWYGTAIYAKHAMPKESQALEREALFYKRNLAHLRGAIVPEFFGFYRSDFWSLLVLEDVFIDASRAGWQDHEEEKSVAPVHGVLMK
jgi:hypothetical protein